MRELTLSRLVRVSLALAGVVWALVGRSSGSEWTQTGSLPSPEAVQAATADDRYAFAIANSQIAKYDRQTGERLAVSSGEAKHLNSGFLWEGKLYCAHSNYPRQPEQSEIKVLDVATMELSTWKDFGNLGGSLTWAVRHEEHWWCHFARYGDENGGSFLVKFDERWNEKSRWSLPAELVRELGRYSLSGGIWRDGHLLVTGHDDPVLFRLKVPEVGTVLQLVDRHRIPFTGQGIAADPVTGGLVGIHRSRKHVVFASQVEMGRTPAISSVAPFSDYAALLSAIAKGGHSVRKIGTAPDRSAIVAIRIGGTKQPSIFISAGAHSTEHAGVAATVALIERLKTEHEVWVVPTRDPIGLNGFRHALSLGLGEVPQVRTPAEADALLREKGEILYEKDNVMLALIGEYGYATRGLYRQLEKGTPFLEPLKGRRIYWPSRTDDMPGAGPLDRAYTLVVTPEGEVLHLNRFHDTAWAPSEVRAVRRLMAEIRPGLTFDLHEYVGDTLWMSARRQRTDDDEIWERRLGREAVQAAAASGAVLAADDYSPGSFFEKLERGLYWLDPGQRGEGLNLVDFAARHYGLGFTIETGMRGKFVDRVNTHVLMVQTAVKLFEERHAAKK